MISSNTSKYRNHMRNSWSHTPNKFESSSTGTWCIVFYGTTYCERRFRLISIQIANVAIINTIFEIETTDFRTEVLNSSWKASGGSTTNMVQWRVSLLVDYSLWSYVKETAQQWSTSWSWRLDIFFRNSTRRFYCMLSEIFWLVSMLWLKPAVVTSKQSFIKFSYFFYFNKFPWFLIF